MKLATSLCQDEESLAEFGRLVHRNEKSLNDGSMIRMACDILDNENVIRQLYGEKRLPDLVKNTVLKPYNVQIRLPDIVQ